MTDQELSVAFDAETFEIPPDIAKLLADIDALEAMSDEGEAVNEAALVLGNDLKIGMDVRRIGIGCIVAKLEPRYGEQTVRKFAARIGSPYPTVTQYARMTEFYGKNTCVFYLTQTPVGYAVMRALYIPTHYDESIKLLERARTEQWTEKQAQREVAITKKALGLPVKDPPDEIIYQTESAQFKTFTPLGNGKLSVTFEVDDSFDLRGAHGERLSMTIKRKRGKK